MAGNRESYEQAMRAAFDHSWNRSWKAAIEAYKQALMEFPEDLAAITALGSAFLEMGQPQVALKVFERAVHLAPQDAQALARLADAQERLGKLEEAAATHTRTGHALAQQGKLEEAADAWTQGSRLVPDQVQAYLNLAQVLEQLGRPEQASVEYTTLATISQRQGDEELVLEYCQEALRLPLVLLARSDPELLAHRRHRSSLDQVFADDPDLLFRLAVPNARSRPG